MASPDDNKPDSTPDVKAVIPNSIPEAKSNVQPAKAEEPEAEDKPKAKANSNEEKKKEDPNNLAAQLFRLLGLLFKTPGPKNGENELKNKSDSEDKSLFAEAYKKQLEEFELEPDKAKDAIDNLVKADNPSDRVKVADDLVNSASPENKKAVANATTAFLLATTENLPELIEKNPGLNDLGKSDISEEQLTKNLNTAASEYKVSADTQKYGILPTAEALAQTQKSLDENSETKNDYTPPAPEKLFSQEQDSNLNAKRSEANELADATLEVDEVKVTLAEYTEIPDDTRFADRNVHKEIQSHDFKCPITDKGYDDIDKFALVKSRDDRTHVYSKEAIEDLCEKGDKQDDGSVFF